MNLRKVPTQSGVAISRKCCFPHGRSDGCVLGPSLLSFYNLMTITSRLASSDVLFIDDIPLRTMLAMSMWETTFPRNSHAGLGRDFTDIHPYSEVCSVRKIAYQIRRGYFSEMLFPTWASITQCHDERPMYRNIAHRLPQDTDL